MIILMQTDISAKLRICILNNSFENSDNEIKGLLNEEPYIAEHFTDAEETCPYEFTNVYIKKATTYSQISALVYSNKYDCFFNLCDGMNHEDIAGEDVVRTLEELNVPFVGIDSKHYDSPKPYQKMIAFYNGIKTPKHFTVCKLPSIEDLRKKCEKLKFPLITKVTNSGGSIGITKDSKCENIEDLYLQIKICLEKFESCLVEEFIIGDEVTVLAVETPTGTKVLHPLKIKFPNSADFKYFDIKWEKDGSYDQLPLEDANPLLGEIQRIGKVAFETILGGICDGRCDLRICRKTNEIYFLEINPMCAIFFTPGSYGSADLILHYDKTYNHRQYVKDQIESSMARYAKKQPLHEIQFDPEKGYLLISKRFIPKGAIVFHNEGSSFNLVTKPYVLSNWNSQKLDDFSKCAWPISADGHVYETIDKDYKNLRPLKHSCESNLIFAESNSLNIIASKDIELNEELSIDFATLYDLEKNAFDCVCGAPSCRKKITASQKF